MNNRLAFAFGAQCVRVPVFPDSLVLGRSAALGIDDLLVSRQHVRVSVDAHDAQSVLVTQLGLRASLVNGSLLARGASTALSVGQCVVLVPPGKFSFTLIQIDGNVDDDVTTAHRHVLTTNVPESAPLPTLSIQQPSQSQSQRRHLSAFDAEVLHFAESLLDLDSHLTDRERQWLVDAASTLRANLLDLLHSDRQCMLMCQAFVRALLTGDSGVADAVLESPAWYWYTAQAALRDARAAAAAAAAASANQSSTHRRVFARTLGDVADAVDDDDDASDSDAAAAGAELLANMSALEDVSVDPGRKSAAQIDQWWQEQARRRESAGAASQAPAAAAFDAHVELVAADQTMQQSDIVAADSPHTAETLATGAVTDFAVVRGEASQSRRVPVNARIANVDQLGQIGSSCSTLLGLWTAAEASLSVGEQATDTGGGVGGDASASVYLRLRPYILVARVQARATGIALVDSRGFVMASFVSPPLAIDDAVLFITDWRCIHWRGRCYIEVAPRGYVMLLPGGGVGVGDAPPRLLTGAQTTMAAVAALGDAGELVPVAQRALAVAEKANKGATMKRFVVRARVRAVSPAMQTAPNDQAGAHYFVRIVAPDGAGACVLFMGDRALLMRHFLHVNAVHVFSHLQVRRMFHGTARERFVLATTDETMLLSASADDWPALHDVETADAFVPPAPPRIDARQRRRHEVAQCVTYRGRVSALLGRGVVELDGRVSLLLAHCQLIDQGLGMRVGALIVAHNVHVIEERERVRALGVCALSRIEVMRHSPLTAPFVPPSRKSSPALYLQPQQCVGFARFLWLFDVQRSLSRKFPRLAVTDAILWGDAELRERGGLLRMLDALRVPANERQLYTEFLDHDRACWLGERVEARSVPLVLDVRSLFATEAYRAAFRAALDEARFVARQLERWRDVPQTAAGAATVRERSSRKLASVVACPRDAMLVAQLQLSADGESSVRLCDATGSVGLCGTAAARVSIRDLGQLFYLEDFALAVEGLPHRIAGGGAPLSDTPASAARASAVGGARTVRTTLLPNSDAVLVVGDLLEASLAVSCGATQSTPAASGTPGVVDQPRGRQRLQQLRLRRRLWLAKVLQMATLAATGDSHECVLCEVHSVVDDGASAFDASVTIQLATRATRTTLRFAGEAARWRHVVTPNSCIVVTSVCDDNVDDDALVFSVCFDESAAVRGDASVDMARWNPAHGWHASVEATVDARYIAPSSMGGDGDVVLALIDPRRSRPPPLSVRGVLSLGAQDALPLTVQARVHERQWLLSDGDKMPWVRLELRDVGGPDFCSARVRADAFECGALLDGATVCIVGAVRAAANGAVRLVGAAGVRVQLVSRAAAEAGGDAAAAQVIVDNGELFRAYLSDVETRTLASLRRAKTLNAALTGPLTPRASVAAVAERAVIYRVAAAVTNVTSVRVAWQCRRCGRAIPNQCRVDCAWPEFALRVVAVAVIDDGTASAVVRALDEFAVALLRLDGDDVRVLRTACYTHGAVEWCASGAGRRQATAAAVNAVARNAWLEDARAAQQQEQQQQQQQQQQHFENDILMAAAPSEDEAGVAIALMEAEATHHPGVRLLGRRANSTTSGMRRVAIYCRQLATTITTSSGGADNLQLFAHRVEAIDDDLHGEARRLLQVYQ